MKKNLSYLFAAVFSLITFLNTDTYASEDLEETKPLETITFKRPYAKHYADVCDWEVEEKGVPLKINLEKYCDIHSATPEELTFYYDKNFKSMANFYTHKAKATYEGLFKKDKTYQLFYIEFSFEAAKSGNSRNVNARSYYLSDIDEVGKNNYPVHITSKLSSVYRDNYSLSQNKGNITYMEWREILSRYFKKVEF